MHWWARGLSCKPNIYVSWSTSKPKVRLTSWNQFKPSRKIFYLPLQGGASFVDHLCFCVSCFSCFRVCSMLPCGHMRGKGWPLGSCWLFIVFLLLFHVVSCARCGTWSYRFQIFAIFLALINIRNKCEVSTVKRVSQSSLFLLSVPRWCIYCESFCYFRPCLSSSCCLVCSL